MKSERYLSSRIPPSSFTFIMICYDADESAAFPITAICIVPGTSNPSVPLKVIVRDLEFSMNSIGSGS